MIPNIRKILYATDLSDKAAHVFGYAAGMADRYAAKVTVLHVLEDISPSTSRQLAFMMGDDRFLELQRKRQQDGIEKIRSQVETFCRDLTTDLQDCNLTVEDVRVTVGDPARQILETAAEIDCDVIVMGTHGERDLADTMLGSTARRVVRRSAIPVLVVRLPAQD